MAQASLDKKWLRPSLIIFCETEPIPGTGGNAGKWELGTNYLYLTDDGRDSVSVQPQRIEYKQRMINGRMRSYYVTDKNTFSTSWTNLPSRSEDSSRKYISEYEKRTTSIRYAAGQEIKSWYETYTGDFWMLLVYDGPEYDQSTNNKSADQQVEKYNVFFDSFSYDITKRGQYNDFWDVSISLVEA